MNIGAVVRELRENKEMSQGELGRAVNVSGAMICQIERGTKTLTLPLAVDIANVLDCKIEDLCKS